MNPSLQKQSRGNEQDCPPGSEKLLERHAECGERPAEGRKHTERLTFEPAAQGLLANPALLRDFLNRQALPLHRLPEKRTNLHHGPSYRLVYLLRQMHHRSFQRQSNTREMEFPVVCLVVFGNIQVL
jgi:hypothetical protein